MEEFREMFMFSINVSSVFGMHCLSSQVGSTSREEHIWNFAYNLSDIFITLSNFSIVLERVLTRTQWVSPSPYSKSDSDSCLVDSDSMDLDSDSNLLDSDSDSDSALADSDSKVESS